MAKISKADQSEAREILLGILGNLTQENERKVYCILRHVSRSGMRREISFYVKDAEGDLRLLDGLIHEVLTDSKGKAYYPRVSKGDGLKVDGCGMDMGFSVVYNLSSILYGNGNTVPRAGYFLRSEWL